MRTVQQYLNDSVEDDDQLLDREALRVPMVMMDHADGGPVDDAEFLLNRPGYRLRSPQQEAAIDAAYALHDESESMAWQRTPTRDDPDDITGAGSHGFRGAQEGDQCTQNGAAGTLKHIEGYGLVCCVDPPLPPPTGGLDGTDPRAATEAAYAAYDAEVEQRYREMSSNK